MTPCFLSVQYRVNFLAIIDSQVLSWLDMFFFFMNCINFKKKKKTSKLDPPEKFHLTLVEAWLEFRKFNILEQRYCNLYKLQFFVTSATLRVQNNILLFLSWLHIWKAAGPLEAWGPLFFLLSPHFRSQLHSYAGLSQTRTDTSSKLFLLPL